MKLTKIIHLIQPGQSLVLLAEDYTTLMRTIGSYSSRGMVPPNIKYKKALIVVDNQLRTGVEVIAE